MFTPLNDELRDLLEKLGPYQFDESFLQDLDRMGDAEFGMPNRQVVHGIWELEALGYVKIYKGGPMNPAYMALTSDGRCYKQLLLKHRRNTVLAWVGNAVTGASGGLVVYFLSLLAR